MLRKSFLDLCSELQCRPLHLLLIVHVEFLIQGYSKVILPVSYNSYNRKEKKAVNTMSSSQNSEIFQYLSLSLTVNQILFLHPLIISIYHKYHIFESADKDFSWLFKKIKQTYKKPQHIYFSLTFLFMLLIFFSNFLWNICDPCLTSPVVLNIIFMLITLKSRLMSSYPSAYLMWPPVFHRNISNSPSLKINSFSSPPDCIFWSFSITWLIECRYPLHKLGCFL